MALNGKGNTGMTREEAICLVDACRDGDISDADVSRLARLLESHDERAMWILDELELSGLIAQALDSTDTNSFLRGFLERLTAERTGDDFADVAEQRLAGKGDPSQLQQDDSGTADAIGMMFGRKSGTAIKMERALPAGRLRVLLIGIVAATLVVAAAVMLRPAPSFGRVVSATQGVMITRESGEVRAAAGMPLRPGDLVQVPRDSRAVLSCEDGTRVKVLAQTRLALGSDDTGNRVRLESGQVDVETLGATDKEPVIIASPHAEVSSTTASEFSITATPTSTRLAVSVGEVTLRRRGSTESSTVAAGDDALISAGKGL